MDNYDMTTRLVRDPLAVIVVDFADGHLNFLVFAFTEIRASEVSASRRLLADSGNERLWLGSEGCRIQYLVLNPDDA
jgi:hypothetical protein